MELSASVTTFLLADIGGIFRDGNVGEDDIPGHCRHQRRGDGGDYDETRARHPGRRNDDPR